jgi:hypothetical protein
MEKRTEIVNPSHRADELEERLIDFAVRIIKLTPDCPRRLPGGTSPGRFCDPELPQRRTTAKPGARKARLTLFTSSASFLRS